MIRPSTSSLPVVRIGQIPSQSSPQRWLVEQLWGDSSVGLIGGAPKCSKTWLGLDLALSVATGTPCLGKYAVPQPGPVLIYLAEDALPTVRQRVEGMARQRGLELPQVDIYVITASSLRLDRPQHRGQLLQTARQLRPRLLLLDPLVRLHGIDENSASEVAELLASEHRAAPASPPVHLQLVATSTETAHLQVVAAPGDQQPVQLPEQVLALLADGQVHTRTKLREQLGVKNERLGQTLESLERDGQLRRTSTGWQRAQ